jgi:DNA repair protein RadC
MPHPTTSSGIRDNHRRGVVADSLKAQIHSVCRSEASPFLTFKICNGPDQLSGPSPSDIAITTQLKAAGAIVGIDLLDHIIFNRSGYFSFLEEGKL